MTDDVLTREVEATEKFGRLHPGLLRDLRQRQKQDPDALSTFSDSWNRASRDEGGGQGLAFGWYVLLSGLTGAGKTLLALNLLAEALRAGTNVLYFSLEMSWEQLATRLRSIVTGCDVTKVEWGSRYNSKEAAKADEAISRLPGNLYLNREPIWRLDDIGTVMEVHRSQHDTRLVIVDYAQLVEPAGSDRALFEAMSEVSSSLRFYAKKLDAVTVALSQMNRTSTRERDRRPTVDGLFGSSRFGFDADQVLMLDHSRREKDEPNRVERTYLEMVKNRHGPAISIPVELDKRNLQIREALPDEEGEWPT